MKRLSTIAFVFLAVAIYGQLRISQLPNTNNLASNQLFVVTAGLTNQSISAGQLLSVASNNIFPSVTAYASSQGPSNWLQNFSIIQFGDLQFMMTNDASVAETSNTLRNTWIAISNSIVPYNVKAFVFSGDFFELTNAAIVTVWSNWIRGMANLVPIVQSCGNHDRDWDWTTLTEISPVAYNTWNSMFPTNWYQSQPWWNSQSGFYNATNTVDMYLTLTNTPFPITIFGLTIGANAARYNWASNLCKTTLSNSYVILSKHDWLVPLPNEDRLIQAADPYSVSSYGYSGGLDPQRAWDVSVKYWSPLGFIYSGHYGSITVPAVKTTARRSMLGEFGNLVNCFQSAYHASYSTPNWTMHTFNPSQNRIDSKICSTNQIAWETSNLGNWFRNTWNIRSTGSGGLEAQDRMTITGMSERTNYPTLGFQVFNASNMFLRYSPVQGDLRFILGTNPAVASNNAVMVIDGTGLKVNSGGATNPVGSYGALMMNATNLVVCAGAASVYTNVAGTGFTTITTNGFYGALTANDAALTNLVAGWYKCIVNLSYLGANSTTYEGEVFTNNVNCDLISWKNATDNPARLRTSTAAGIIYLPAGCRVDFRIQDAGAGSSLSVHRASLVVGTP